LDGLGTVAKLALLNLPDNSFLISLNKVDVGYMANTIKKIAGRQESKCMACSHFLDNSTGLHAGSSPKATGPEPYHVCTW
jgi:hypothetical protein